MVGRILHQKGRNLSHHIFIGLTKGPSKVIIAKNWQSSLGTPQELKVESFRYSAMTIILQASSSSPHSLTPYPNHQDQ